MGCARTHFNNTTWGAHQISACKRSLCHPNELLNALALQKVVSDQQAAKNQLTLSQQQQPGTIAEQLEMQAQKGSQDRTQAVMGVYNQNKANQDKGARNLAKKEASKTTASCWAA